MKSAIICINGWRSILRITSYWGEFTASVVRKINVSSYIYFQEPDFDFTLVKSYEKSSSLSLSSFNLAYGRLEETLVTAFVKHMARFRCTWVTNGSILADLCIFGISVLLGPIQRLPSYCNIVL